MRGYVAPDAGYMGEVLRLVFVGSLVAVVAAGCGGAARPRQSALRGVPSALAWGWEGQVTAIAHAASTGESCHALQLAKTLRADVARRKRELPPRLLSPLVTGVNELVARLNCPPPTTAATTTAPKPQPKPPPTPPHEKDHHDHGPHGHDRGPGGDGGDGGDGG
jgi:hypothetical protein